MKRIERRKKIYRKEGRSDLWKIIKKQTEDMIKERKKVYMDMKKVQLTEKNANRSFFRLVKAFNTPEKAQTFDVRTFCPGATDQQVADDLADYFNQISAEFDPLTPSQIPITHHRQIEILSPHQVSRRIKSFRKPKLMVRGDVFPSVRMDVVTEEGSEAKAAAYQATIDWAMDKFFPLHTTKRISTDLSWINDSFIPHTAIS